MYGVIHVGKETQDIVLSHVTRMNTELVRDDYCPIKNLNTLLIINFAWSIPCQGTVCQ